MRKGKRQAMLVRVPERTFGLITRWSRMLGVTRNDFVVALLTDALPHLEKLVEAMEEAKKGATRPALAAMSAAMTDALREQHRLVGETQFQLGLQAAASTAPVKRRGRSG